jgi:hypothetical protein
MTEQLELLPAHPDEHLFPYWRKQLAAWPCDVFQFRNMRDTTGWSMATQKMCFARWLFRAGQMSRAEFRRCWRFKRAVMRRDQHDLGRGADADCVPGAGN